MIDQVNREKYIVVLEIDIPAAGTKIEDHSIQNPPTAWNWKLMINSDKPPYDYRVKSLACSKIE